MDCFSAGSPVERVVFLKGSQVGGTEVGNNLLGYVIDHAPGPMTVVLPSDKLLRRHSRSRIDPLLKTPCLSGKVGAQKSRSSSNSVLEKHFPGGMLVMASASSPGDLRSTPIRYLVLDEVDAYPIDLAEEGDPVELAERGTRTYPGSKVLEVSTPTIEGRSRIARDFELTDRRYYHVPCPHCGAMQRIEWTRISWEEEDGEDDSDLYRALKSGERAVWLDCIQCDEPIRNEHKTAMLAAGQWIPENPDHGDLERGYHLSALYAPVGLGLTWGQVAAKFVRARTRPNLLKVFVNQVLGETWRDKGEAPAWRTLYLRRERYAMGTVPSGAVILTAGVDVQRDRLEIEVVGWGPNMESWSIDYRTISGDPAKQETWRELEQLVASPWRHESGVDLFLKRVAVDSSYATQDVYRWVRRQPRSRVIAVKGRDSLQQVLGQPRAVDITTLSGRKVQRGAMYWPVGVSLLKEELYGWLRADPPIDGEPVPFGWCHWPQYDDEYFKQLTAEQLVTKMRARTGRVVYEWQKTRERNEALDVRNYARAAASALGIDRWGPDQWESVRAEIGVAAEAERRLRDQEAQVRGERRRGRGQGAGRNLNLDRHRRRR